MAATQANLWEPGKRAPRASAWFAYEGRIISIAFSPDGKLFLLSFEERAAPRKFKQVTHIFDLGTGKAVRKFSNGASHRFLPDSKHTVALVDKGVTVFSIKTGKNVFAFTPKYREIQTFCIAPGSDRIAVVINENEAEILDIKTGKRVRHCVPKTAYINALAFSPDGRRLATFGEYETDYDYIDRSESGHSLWNVAGRPKMVWEDHSGLYEQVIFSPDGTRLYAVGTGEINRWHTSGISVLEADTGERIYDWESKGMRFDCMALSADGNLVVASGGRDSSYNDLPTEILMWDTASGELRGELVGHTNSVDSLTLSPDRTRLVSQSRDRTMRVWNTVTGKELRRFEQPKDYRDRFKAAFSVDSAIIAIAGGTKLNFYDIQSGNEIMQTPQGKSSQ